MSRIRFSARWLLTVVLSSVTASAAFAQWEPQIKNDPLAASAAAPVDSQTPSVRDGFTFAAGGDLLGPYRPRFELDDPQFAQVMGLFQAADAGFANLEGNLFDTWNFDGFPAAENGGGEQGGIGSGPLLPKSAASALRAMGITMLSTANNHSLDWGIEGMLATLRNLDDAGVVHAGSGRGLHHALAPGFLGTKRGRVALVGSASTFTPMGPAGGGGGDGRLLKAPRPGIAALRNRPIALVTAQEFETIKQIALRQGKRVDPGDREITLAPNEAVFIQQSFRLADRTGLTYELEPDDRKGVLNAVGAAKRGADFAVYAIHAHETASGGQEFDAPPDSLAPADFLPQLFHDAVDAGADVVVTHGPHVLRGVEIYKGKPVFYGLGSLFFTLGSGFPREWYDSVVAVTEVRGERVVQVRLYPVVLGAPEERRAPLDQGIPHRAAGVDARRILATLQRQSDRYGTKIRIEKDVGIIDILH